MTFKDDLFDVHGDQVLYKRYSLLKQKPSKESISSEDIVWDPGPSYVQGK